MKPTWATDGIELYLGDCREILPTLAPGSVQAVITDPPYGIGGKWQGGFSDKHGWGKAKTECEVRNEWDDAAPDQSTIDLILSLGKQHIIWGGNYFNLPLSRCWLVWNKPERNFTLAECELAWTDFDNVARVCDCRRSDPDRFHPTQKPLALMEWCVEKTKGTVCDPFLGSGTTALACLRAGRKCIGIEREKSYLESAIERLKKTIDTPLFDPTPKLIQRGLLT